MNVTIMPLLYIIICVYIVVFPFVVFSRSLSNLTVTPIRNYERMNDFFIILLPFVSFLFVELLYGAFSTNTQSLGDIYETSFDSGGKENNSYALSWINQRVMNFIFRLYFVWPILLFECLRRKGLIKKMAIVPSLCILCLILQYYTSAQRVGIVRTIMYIFVVYYFYKNSLSLLLKNRIRKYGTIALALLATLLILITIARYSVMSDMNLSIGEWLSLYLGEGPIRFSNYIWDLNRTSDGDTSFSFIKSVFGLDTFLDYYDRRLFYESYFGIPTNIFYTFVGDWYQDFGRVGTVALCVFFMIIEYAILKRAIQKRKLSSLMVFSISIIAFAIMFGFMFFVFKVAAAQENIVQSLFALLVIKIFTSHGNAAHSIIKK